VVLNIPEHRFWRMTHRKLMLLWEKHKDFHREEEEGEEVLSIASVDYM
jgi:hypothetical protein